MNYVLCTVTGCAGRSTRGGLCNAHSHYKRRHGFAPAGLLATPRGDGGKTEMHVAMIRAERKILEGLCSRVKVYNDEELEAFARSRGVLVAKRNKNEQP